MSVSSRHRKHYSPPGQDHPSVPQYLPVLQDAVSSRDSAPEGFFMSTTLPQVTISNVTIRQDLTGRYCINDLHRAAGGELRHKPANWLRNAQTVELIEELATAQISAVERIQPVISVPGSPDTGGGTFVAKELVYAYAMWISPKFHLQVIQTFDKVMEEQKPKTPGEALVEMAQNFLAHERALHEHGRQIAELATQQSYAQAQLSALVHGENYMTIVGWAKRHGIYLDASKASVMGLRVSRFCRDHGIATGEAPHPIYGRVKSYPLEVLDEVFQELIPDPDDPIDKELRSLMDALLEQQ